LCLRATLLFSSRPILQYLHADKLPVTWQDATLMTWGGLRGAVGLALAIQVNNDRAPMCVDPITGVTGTDSCMFTGAPQIHAKDAQRLLFFVSGVAFLTTLVNATTAPALVGKLGITALPAARQTLLKMFHQQLVNWSEDGGNPEEVTESLKHMLHEAAHHIAHQRIAATGPASSRNALGEIDPSVNFKDMAKEAYQSNQDLIAAHKAARAKFESIPKEDTDLLGPLDEAPNLNGKVDDMLALIEKEEVDVGMAKVVNQCFLTLVFNNYWKLIEQGSLRPGSPESDVLLTSVRIALSPYRANLIDFGYVHEKMIGKEGLDHDDQAAEAGALSEDIPEGASTHGFLPELVSSSKFNIFIALAILFNAIATVVEEVARGGDDSVAWLIMDGVFTTIFVTEFFLKLCWLKCGYFRDNWNRFDFFLVLVGVGGFMLNATTSGGAGSLPRLMKLARVLRTMRFLRVFRLMNARLSADKHVSVQLGRHLKKITTMSCFISAHFMAQIDLVKYFGGNGKIDEKEEAEIARCVVQSQVSTYQALLAAANTQKQISKDILFELETLYQRKIITEGLSEFVSKAHSDGAISATEAHAILHPLNHQVSDCMKTLNERAEGVTSKGGDSHGGHGGHHDDSKVEPISPQVLGAARAEELPPLAPIVQAPGSSS